MWYNDTGKEEDTVVSTRVRLARNIKNYPFPQKITKKQDEEIIENLKKSLKYNFIEVPCINKTDKFVLLEKHLISPQMVTSNLGGVFVDENEIVSVMVNEEDHLRIQCIKPGLDIDDAFELANEVDDIIEERHDYAFSENFGYLTSCPTNTGTGIRISVMMHLPALVMYEQIGNLINSISKFNITVRGLYGEGTRASGNLFQISNQITLGISEQENVENLKNIIKQISAEERRLREQLIQNDKIIIEDRLYRAYGILKNARILSSEEFMRHYSDVKLAIYYKMVDTKDKTLNNLMIMTKPALLIKAGGGNLSSRERDIKRADITRSMLE